MCRNTYRQIKIRSVPVKRKERLSQEAIPALKSGQSWNMSGSLKILATKDAAIREATFSHFSLEDWVSSAKPLMPLTTIHSVLKSWAASNTPEEEKKHACVC